MKTVITYVARLLPIIICWEILALSPKTPVQNDVHFFALLVGSNLPGENQSPLRYAHEDMKKMGTVLEEIGKYDGERISRLTDPGTQTLKNALERIRHQMAALPSTSQTRFVFYYSGHAKSNALTLGRDNLSLKTLRDLLNAIPSSQKIIILDACQSGSFSSAKGVQVSEDFSHNSRATLETRGTAVLASSSADELSQESDEVKGSLFTHNLVTGLRGAADADTNGRVSLFEAYDYAYNSTLIASANTRIGKQHVTMETDLEGTGETVLTWPAASSAKLVLPKDVHGTVVVFDKQSNTIHAEIHKAKGSDITLAFPPGNYGVIVTHNQKALNCEIRLKKSTITRVKKNSCQTTKLKSGNAKNDLAPTSDPYRWAPFVELQFGVQFLRKDAFIRRLERLGYRSDEFEGGKGGNEAIPYGEALVGVTVNRYFSLGVLYSTLDRLEFIEYLFTRTTEGKRNYRWVAHRFCTQLRFQYPFLNDRLTPYAFADLGIGIVKDNYSGQVFNIGSHFLAGIAVNDESSQTFRGSVLGGGIGLNARLQRWISIVTQFKYIYAPIMKNRYDEQQDAGGWIFSGGVRIGQ